MSILKRTLMAATLIGGSLTSTVAIAEKADITVSAEKQLTYRQTAEMERKYHQQDRFRIDLGNGIELGGAKLHPFRSHATSSTNIEEMFGITGRWPLQ